MRRPLLVLLALLAACAAENAFKGHAIKDDDGELVTDLSRIPELRRTAFENPRRYPFTVAVAPLYVDWSDGGAQEGDSTVHGETLPSQLPLDDPRGHPRARGWPGNEDPDEEAQILLALRGQTTAAATGSALPFPPPGAAPPNAPQQPPPDRPLPECPPEEELAEGPTPASEPAAVMRYTPPAGWLESAAVGSSSGTFISAHVAPVDSQTGAAAVGSVTLGWEPRVAHVLEGAPLARAERAAALLNELRSLEPAATPGEPEWTQLDGHPAVELRAVLGERAVWLVRVFTAERVFTLRVDLPAGAGHVFEQLHQSIDVSGPMLQGEAELTQQEEARRAELDGFRGKNFAVTDLGFRDRMVGLLEQFGMFERVEGLEISQDMQRRDHMELLPEADRVGADLLLVARLRRNKVSYQGISNVPRFLLDFSAWLLFWWPSEIWPGVDSEDWRADVELLVELIDVRSKETLWSKTYRHDETQSLSTPDRGWVPWGVLLVRFGLLTDNMIAGAGEHVRAPTWLEVEYQVLSDLWAAEGFKGVIDTAGFEDRVNGPLVRPRRTALVAAVGRYGERAAPVLARLDEEAARVAGLDLAARQAEYEDPALTWGVRPYAEEDARRVGELLQNQARFDRDHSPVLLGGQVGRVALKARLRQLAKARREDPAFLWLAGETVVADDPDQPGDRLAKFFLPHDADLVGLEELLAQPASPTRRDAILAHLERTAISFEWLAETFNRADREDHRYLQSRQAFVVIDATFPGRLTGLRYAPEFAARMTGGSDEPSRRAARVTLSSRFLDELADPPGRLVVLTARFGEPLLDVVPQKQGAFAYHFLRGAEQRVPFRDGTKSAGRLVEYARGRIEDESRTLDRPQSVLMLGNNQDIPLLTEER